jgi:broad specificity phosphatase PhoE
MGRLLLARSGFTPYDEEGRIAGDLDLPLSVRGEAEMTRLADSLRNGPPAIVYTADVESARASGAILAEALGVPVKILKGLTCIRMGLWQGQARDELKRKQPRLWRQWLESPETVHPPEGEPLAEALERNLKPARTALKKARSSEVLLLLPDPLRRLLRGRWHGTGFAAFHDEELPDLESFAPPFAGE